MGRMGLTGTVMHEFGLGVRFSVCVAVAGLGVVFAGCGLPPRDTTPLPYHFTQEAFRRDVQREHPPLEIPLNERWYATAGALGITEEGLTWTRGADGGHLAIDVQADAAFYNTLELRMKADTGSVCRVAWLSEHEPELAFEKCPSTSGAIFSDNKFHTYIFRLSRERWFGSLRRLMVSPLELPGAVSIQQVRLAYRPPEAPLRVTLGGVSMEALYGTQPATSFVLPEGAVLEAYAGMLPAAWEMSAKGVVEFQVLAQRGQEAPLMLYRRKMTPGVVAFHHKWLPIYIDLGQFAHQQIRLHLRVNHAGLPQGDYAFWGDPRVFVPRPAPPTPPAKAPVPVFLISCDTLRADHLSCYGYERQTSPELDAFAKRDAVLFENALTPETYTLPAHISMFTGLHSEHHRTTRYTNLAEEVTTLPEMLRGAGYLTAGFTGHNWWLLPERGFAQGMDYYDVPAEAFRHVYRTTDRVQDWLQNHPYPRQFLFFHNYDLHAKLSGEYQLPYDPGDKEYRTFSEEDDGKGLLLDARTRGFHANDMLEAYNDGKITFTPEEHAYILKLYDDCIRLVDESIGDFLRSLQVHGLYDNALIIVTSDHGESHNEHGFYGHFDLFEEIAHVPLLIKFPDNAFAGQRYAEQVTLEDIMPTIQDVLDLPALESSDGVSLLQALHAATPAPATPANEATPTPAPAHPYLFLRRGGKIAVRTNEWKLHWDDPRTPGREALFQLTSDPLEMQDRLEEKPPVLAALEQELASFFDQKRDGWHVQLLNAPPTWSGHLLLTSTAPISSLFYIDENNVATPQPIEHPQTVEIKAAAPWPHLLIRTTEPGAQLQVNLKSDTLFTLAAGQREPIIHVDFSGTLDPAAPDLAKPNLDAIQTAPIIALWYETTAHAGTAAATPTEEQKQQLRALGYVE
ncbi:MAG: sulfatase [Candidatus Hydrogenedentes bacterium]|nr:sulfatase [Candidatus Hydrogenedentota bacterium]